MDVTTWLDDLTRRDETIRETIPSSSPIEDLQIAELKARVQSAEAEIAFRDTLLAAQSAQIAHLNSLLGRGKRGSAAGVSTDPSFDNMLRYYAAKSPAPLRAVLNTGASSTRAVLTTARSVASRLKR